MRSVLFAACAALVLALTACAEHGGGSAGGHPNLIVVREFSFSPGIVALDPSFGFSLYRGSPGVPPRQRAESVGRAAAFNLADTVVQQLQSLGYDAVRSNTLGPEPGGKALFVTGAFRSIYEGHRRENAHVSVAVEVDYQAAGSPAQRLQAFDLDSRRVPPSPTPAAARHGTGVNFAADQVGAAVARYIAGLARTNNWPTASR